MMKIELKVKGLITIFRLCIILALLSSCHFGEESKASAFLYENNRHYAYTETALVGFSGNVFLFLPISMLHLAGRQSVRSSQGRKCSRRCIVLDKRSEL